MHKNTILSMLLIASPILFVLAVYPDSFSMSWNQGRGGFLFGLAFIVAEIIGIKFIVSRTRLIFGIPLAIATIIYFVLLVRIVIAGPVFLGGSAIILSLDAFFPYDTLGPLQYFVPHLVQTNVWVINAFELGTATARDNLMFLRGDHGPFALQVFWPSAGVHSVVIYSLVMMAFLLKMNIKQNRKIMYFGLGIIKKKRHFKNNLLYYFGLLTLTAQTL